MAESLTWPAIDGDPKPGEHAPLSKPVRGKPAPPEADQPPVPYVVKFSRMRVTW